MEEFNWVEVGSDSRRLGEGMKSETGNEATISSLPLWASGVKSNCGPSESTIQNGHLEQTSGVCVINVHLSVVEECSWGYNS